MRKQKNDEKFKLALKMIIFEGKKPAKVARELGLNKGVLSNMLHGIRHFKSLLLATFNKIPNKVQTGRNWRAAFKLLVQTFQLPLKKSLVSKFGAELTPFAATDQDNGERIQQKTAALLLMMAAKLNTEPLPREDFWDLFAADRKLKK